MTTIIKEQLMDKLLVEANKGLELDLEEYKEKCRRQISENMSVEEITNVLINNALENIDEANPNWSFFASRIYLHTLYREAARNRNYEPSEKYGDFYELIDMLTRKGIYTENLLKKYTKEEVKFFGEQIDPKRDLLFNYLALHTLATRYLATDYEKNVYELPQERWMIIAMHLMQDEDEGKRTDLVLEAYWALSNLYMTVATPTLTNAGKTYGQLSSCFIDTVDDSLQSIYDVNTDVAQLSKHGGGIGVYMGKVRGRGSAIKGFKGMSSGVVPWIRQLNKIGRAHV